MKKLTIDEAEELAMETDYAVFASEPKGNEINKADAGAFFLEGYNYAVKLFNKSHLPQVVVRSEQLKCDHKGRRTATELVEYCEDCKKILFHP